MRARKYPVPDLCPPPSRDASEIEGYIDVYEAADFLRRTVSAIRNLHSRRKIPGYKLGGKLLFKKSELDRCVKSSFTK